MSKNIFNDENYHKEINYEDINNYIYTFNKIVNHFLISSSETIKIKQDEYLKFILQKGINTLLNVFRFLILYTKNLDLISLHCEKSYLYYIEFIGQIGHENKSYLQLSSKDAILFVYKKSIFDINNEYKKCFDTNQEERLKLKVIDLNNKCINYFRNFLFKKINICENQEKSLQKIKSLTEQFIKRLLMLNTSNIIKTIKNLEFLIEFLKVIELKQIELNKYTSIVECVCKKIKKQYYNATSINIKTNGIEFDKKIIKNSPLKFVNWLFE